MCLNAGITSQPLEFSGFDAERRLQFWLAPDDLSDAELKVIEPGEFLWWNGPVAGFSQPLWLLRDGSQLAGNIGSLNPTEAELESRYWQPFTVSRQWLQAILVFLPANHQQRDRWLERLQEPVTQDRVWTRDGNYIDGVVMDMDQRGTLTIEVDSRSYRIEADRLMAIAFAGSPRSDRSTDWEISLRDGCRLQADTWQVSDQELQVTLGAEVYTLAPRNRNLLPSMPREVCGLRIRRMQPEFLSELTPLNYRHEPLVGAELPLQTNRSVAGGRFTHGNTLFEHGLGMTSKSSVVFRLDENFRALHFGLAIDESSGNHGSVVCRVLTLDANRQWREAWVSDEIRGGQAPVFQTVSLVGATAVALTVDYGDKADVLDRANWLMPTLVR